MIRTKKTPWDYVHEGDVRNFGEFIKDRALIQKWARAFLFAGLLPYMWDTATEFKKLMYDYLELKKGDRVLLIGERVDVCGFEKEVRKRIGSEGELRVYDYTDRARQLILEGKPGKFSYDFSRSFKDNYFDAVFLPQAANNCDNWDDAARDLVRVLKKQKMLVLAEITLGGPTFKTAINSDMHIRAWIEKIMVNDQGILSGELYTSPDELLEAFDDLLEDIRVFQWRDAMLIYGRKV